MPPAMSAINMAKTSGNAHDQLCNTTVKAESKRQDNKRFSYDNFTRLDRRFAAYR